jgi:hypothetical protein
MSKRCILHGVKSCPVCRPALPPHLPERPASQFNLAIGADGNPLPYSSEEIKTVALKAVDDGDILAVLIRLPSGDLSFQVYGPPSRDLLDTLKCAISSYERTLDFVLPSPDDKRS